MLIRELLDPLGTPVLYVASELSSILARPLGSNLGISSPTLGSFYNILLIKT